VCSDEVDSRGATENLLTGCSQPQSGHEARVRDASRVQVCAATVGLSRVCGPHRLVSRLAYAHASATVLVCTQSRYSPPLGTCNAFSPPPAGDASLRSAAHGDAAPTSSHSPLTLLSLSSRSHLAPISLGPSRRRLKSAHLQQLGSGRLGPRGEVGEGIGPFERR